MEDLNIAGGLELEVNTLRDQLRWFKHWFVINEGIFSLLLFRCFLRLADSIVVLYDDLVFEVDWFTRGALNSNITVFDTVILTILCRRWVTKCFAEFVCLVLGDLCAVIATPLTYQVSQVPECPNGYIQPSTSILLLSV